MGGGGGGVSDVMCVCLLIFILYVIYLYDILCQLDITKYHLVRIFHLIELISLLHNYQFYFMVFILDNL